MPKFHCVHLAADEREELLSRIRVGVDADRVLCRARILLHADESHPEEGWFDDEIASALHVGRGRRAVPENLVTLKREQLRTDGGVYFFADREV
ncbi:MAG TPA: hypothetical protein VGS41_03040 [Chthonomonadales bacterium]|nr:hypothetical protein [Chthonomonadales bacterium]